MKANNGQAGETGSTARSTRHLLPRATAAATRSHRAPALTRAYALRATYLLQPHRRAASLRRICDALAIISVRTAGVAARQTATSGMATALPRERGANIKAPGVGGDAAHGFAHQHPPHTTSNDAIWRILPSPFRCNALDAHA